MIPVAEIRTFKSYEELKNKHHEEFNQFPLGAAFSNKQFEEMMTKWGLDPEKDKDKIIHIGAGAFIRKSDLNEFNAIMKRFKEEEDLFKKSDDNLVSMFRYELSNHEYICSHDPEDTLEACGFTLEEYEKDSRLKTLFEKARRLYFRDMAALGY